ncbi:hypothetical protein D9M70_603980 [compost metagenome]
MQLADVPAAVRRAIVDVTLLPTVDFNLGDGAVSADRLCRFNEGEADVEGTVPLARNGRGRSRLP